MYMNVCMYMYVCMSMYVCMYVCVHEAAFVSHDCSGVLGVGLLETRPRSGQIRPRIGHAAGAIAHKL